MTIWKAIAFAAGMAVAGIVALPAAQAAPLSPSSGRAIADTQHGNALTQVRWNGGGHGFRGGGFRGGRGGFRGGGWRGGYGHRYRGGGLGLGLAAGALLGSGAYYGYPYYNTPYYGGAYYDEPVYYYSGPRYYRVRHHVVHRARRAVPCRIVSHGHVYKRPGCR